MSKPQSLQDTSHMPVAADAAMFWERRQELNGDGNPVYIGWNRTPNASTTALSWFIVKFTYTGTTPTSFTRYQIPIPGVEFKYAWDSRANYF